MDQNENSPKSVLDRIDLREQQLIQHGELRYTPVGTFHFPYLRDPRYQNENPALKSALDQLHIPDVTVIETEKAVRDLRIKRPLTVTTVIPTDEEMVYVIPSLGIGGRTVSAVEIHYYFNPTHPRVIESLQTWKKRQIAHEANHAARQQAYRRGTTLLDAFINEGLATSLGSTPGVERGEIDIIG